MSKYDAIRSKRYIICAIIEISCILIYDIIFLFIQDTVNLAYWCYFCFREEILLLLYIIMLFKINRDLAKSNNYLLL